MLWCRMSVVTKLSLNKEVLNNYIHSLGLNKYVSYVIRKHKSISYIFFVLLLSFICVHTAKLFFNLLPNPKNKNYELTQTELKSFQKIKIVYDLNKYFIFGEEPKVTPSNSNNTKKTNETVISKLDIVITGISASTDPTKGSVVIKDKKGAENIYGINDKIDGTSAKIIKIYPDKIIVENNGRNESIQIPGEDISFSVPSFEEKTQPKNKEQLKQIRTELLSNSGNLFKYITIQPEMENGAIKGFRLGPGVESKLFLDSGLQDGDIAVEINGYDLRDSIQSMKLMNELQNITNIEMIIERNGDRKIVTVDLN